MPNESNEYSVIAFFHLQTNTRFAQKFQVKKDQLCTFFKDGNDARRFFFLVNVLETASTGASQGNAQPHKWSSVCKLVQADCSS